MSSRIRRTLVGTGAAAAGAYAGLAAAGWWHDQLLPSPVTLPPALDWSTQVREGPHGRYHMYTRPGTGTPIVLLHSINAAASTVEMKPIAEHLAERTDRPVHAVDWLGFGRSSRPDIDYTPRVYLDQLYRVLNEAVDGPSDVVALSLGCEYAAWAALQTAPLVRRLALISPTGLSRRRRPSYARRLVSMAAAGGLFRLFFYRYTRRTALRRFYARQVFLDRESVPSDLVDYAHKTAHAKGGHYAPQAFLQGALSLSTSPEELYGWLYRPTLILTPVNAESTIQSFDLLSSVLNKNTRDLSHEQMTGGLMPHWDASRSTLSVLEAFLSSS